MRELGCVGYTFSPALSELDCRLLQEGDDSRQNRQSHRKEQVRFGWGLAKRPTREHFPHIQVAEPTLLLSPPLRRAKAQASKQAKASEQKQMIYNFYLYDRKGTCLFQKTFKKNSKKPSSESETVCVCACEFFRAFFVRA